MPNVLPLYESLLALAKELRETRLQIESLRAMMLEHRPAFAPEYARHEAMMAESKAIKSLDARIAAIEGALAKIRER